MVGLRGDEPTADATEHDAIGLGNVAQGERVDIGGPCEVRVDLAVEPSAPVDRSDW